MAKTTNLPKKFDWTTTPANDVELSLKSIRNRVNNMRTAPTESQMKHLAYTLDAILHDVESGICSMNKVYKQLRQK